MGGDWKMYAVFYSEGGDVGQLATRKPFVGKQAALMYAKKHLEYLVDVGGWFVLIPMAEIKKVGKEKKDAVTVEEETMRVYDGEWR